MRSNLPAQGLRRAGHFPAAMVVRITSRRAIRSGAVWGYVFGAYLATQAFAFASTYKTAASRAVLVREFASNSGIAAIVGPAHAIGTVGGFTVWKCLVVLAVVGAVWGLLAGTRLLRGEEDAGRWELLLAGQTTRRRAALQGLIGLGSGLVVLWAVTALILVIVGRSSKVDISPAGALFLAFAVVSGAGMFLAVGALAGQIAGTRRQAAGCAGALLGLSFGLRMVADSGTGLVWLRWVSPLGWVEQLQPLTAPKPLAMVPIIGLTLVLVILTVYLAGVRDLGAGALSDRGSARSHLRLMSGPFGLVMRLVRPSLIGWGVAIGAMSLLLGLVAKSAGVAMMSSPSLRLVLSRFGARTNGATAYLGIALLIVATVVAFLAAEQISAARSEEAGGYLEHLVVRPFSRTSWLVERIVVAVGGVILCGVFAGTVTWFGNAIEHGQVGFVELLEAGVNVVPPALCVLGIGVFTFGLWPRVVGVTTYGFLAWSFLIELVGGIVGLNHYLLDTSVFHQMTSAPSVPVDWTTDAILVAVGVVTGILGTIAFNRRDLIGE